MQTNTSDFVNLSAFAPAVADHLKETLNGTVAGKRVFNLDEAAEYCGLTRDSFKKKVVPDRLRKVRLDKCSRFNRADLDAWIESHKEQIAQETVEYLFIDDHGNPITDFLEPWSKACQPARVPRPLFRDLRRTATRNMFHGGFAESTIAQGAGVKTLSLLWRCTTTDKKDILATGRLLQRYFDQQRELHSRGLIDVKPN